LGPLLLESELEQNQRYEKINLTLFEISNAINTTSSLDELYKIIHLALSSIIDTTNFYIASYDKVHDSVTFPYIVDTVDVNYLPVIEISKTASLTAEVIKTGAPIMITKADILAQQDNSSLINPGCTPAEIWLGVPLKYLGEIVGVMTVQNYNNPLCYDQMDMKVMVAVADQVALAIERKQAEKALKESEARFHKLLLEIPSVAVQGYKLDGTTLFWNQASERLYGYTPQEAIGRNFLDLIIPLEMKRDVKQAMQLMGETGAHIPPSELSLKRKDDSRVTVFSSHSIVEISGREPELFCFDIDITDRKQAEEALLVSEARYARAVRGTSDGLWDWNVVTNEDYLSPRWKELLGFEEDELANEYNKFFSRVHPDDVSRVHEALKAHFDQCIPYNIKLRLRTKSGDYKWFQARGMAERDEQGRVVTMSGSITDLTEFMQAEAEKKKLEEQLRQVYKMEAVGTMAGGIAHDFNNILAIIVGNTEMIKEDTPLGDPIRDYTDDILIASIRARDLIKQILAFSRKEKAELIPIRPQPLLKETLKLLRSTTPQTVSIVQEISQDCHSVLADPTQLHQLVMNFFTNAVHAMDEKGEITVSLEEVDLGREDFDHFPVMLPIGFNKSGVYAKLSVSDTGNGIDTEIIYRVFDPFYTTKDVGEGTGMGLAVVYGIVENHMGFITVDSQIGKGSTFSVFFPITKQEEVLELDTTTGVSTGTEQILLIDDEESLLKMAKHMLASLGYKVVSEGSSVKALETFKSDPDQFDLIITDQSMPDLSGSELAEKVLRIKPDMSIILCSGFSSKVSEENAGEKGISKYVSKPYTKKSFASAIREVLDMKV